MTIAFWCVLGAILLPYAFTSYAKIAGRVGAKKNANPRVWLDKLEGPAQRANWAQQNSFEIHPAFAAAVIIAQFIGTAPQATLDQLAIAFLVSRVVYGACYMMNWATLRTLVWASGLVIIASFFVVSA
ncbi:MAG: MAPEG family protein [Alcanivoracaceae bacterium]|nr:MAPEG family protein [Alcanivoracaceae bacterium]